ncbi:DNA polymerase IV [Thermoanaerobacterium sp. DL9XJH110]|uniref:DNA polymerase IV n=1 Tax=Thermoanaerobacterium sp. DL9XJH110 TaxID=3386643 RepID=UPI003BB4F211
MLPIIHVDMNAFYASCHQAKDPGLRGKPVLVAGDPARRNGIILTASYEARRFGVKTAMPNWEAKKLCPHAIFIKPDYELYVRTSERVMEILRRFSPLVEVFSIDEAWLDVTGCEGLFGDSVEIAGRIQEAILKELGLTCSVGVSCNKLLAKMASDLKKPGGLTVLAPEDVPRVLWPLPVDELFGVGRRMAEHLKGMNINTIGDLAQVPVEFLEKAFGLVGRHLHLAANGIDDSPVDPHSMDTASSMGHSVTLSRDVTTWEEAEAVLLSLSDKVGRRVRRESYVGRTVTITLRDASFCTITRSVTIPHTSATEDIYAAARKLLHANWDGKTPLRLLGVSLSRLVREFDQVCLFENEAKKKRLNRVIDEIRDRFGDGAIFRAKMKSHMEYSERKPPLRKGLV